MSAYYLDTVTAISRQTQIRVQWVMQALRMRCQVMITAQNQIWISARMICHFKKVSVMIKFKKSEKIAEKDRMVFCGWEKKVIQPSTAAKRIAENNEIDPDSINIAGFEEMAIRLGYRRMK